jgi:hypothetical protein
MLVVDRDGGMRASSRGGCSDGGVGCHRLIFQFRKVHDGRECNDGRQDRGEGRRGGRRRFFSFCILCVTTWLNRSSTGLELYQMVHSILDMVYSPEGTASVVACLSLLLFAPASSESPTTGSLVTFQASTMNDVGSLTSALSARPSE